MKRKFKNLVKYLFLGGLICTGVSACSDDALEGEGMQGQKESTPAYLTLAFSTNGNAESRGSTADSGYNNGDGDGDAEDSGHYTEGLEAEYKVNTVLVIAAPQDDVNVGFAKLYSANVVPSDETANSQSNRLFYVYDDKVTASKETGNTPIELAVGNYKILVVVNPPVGDNGLIETNFTSITDLAGIKALYEKVEDEAFNPSEDTYKLYLGGKLREGGVMMANKVTGENGPDVVTLTEKNTPENPLQATVQVERAISKITYREVKQDNKYPITIETDVKASSVAGVVINDDDTYTKIGELYWAKDKNGNTFGIQYVKNSDETTSMYAYNVTDETRVIEEVNYHVCTKVEFVETATESGCFVTDKDDPAGSLKFIYDDADGTRETYYVTIQGYALVNVAKTVNYVRHTIGYSDTYGTPWGSVAQKYLWTPGWAEKNAVKDYSTFNYADYFYNTLADVSAESKTLTPNTIANATYFKPMSALVTDSSTEVDGEEHKDYATGQEYDKTGLTMGYCLENSVDIDHQVHGLTTGISFVATVSDENGDPVEAMYRYNGYTYLSLKAIQKAYGKDHFDEDFNAIVAGTTSETKENLLKCGIVKYESNVCYYYTTEIKHFDNGNANSGYMEFAIMRNNIYSMAIKGIRSVGDPYIDPTPDIPNESGKAALDVEVKIVPWIVRFNDIEF